MNNDTQLFKLMSEILTHLPESADLDMTTLKGQLILERELYSLMNGMARSVNPIKDAKLEFHQLAKIVKSLKFDVDDAWLWGAINMLNQIRNEYAHNLTPGDIDKHVDEFINLVEGKVGKTGDSRQERYRRAIAHICGHLQQMRITP